MGLLALKYLCLREIVESFDRVNHAFSLETAVFKRSFDFLQRVYSQEILNMLVKADNLKEEFLNFLINPYLEELTLKEIMHNCRWEVIREKLVKFGYGIQKLVISDYCSQGPLYSADVMNHMPNIKILHLHDVCTDDDLIILSKCCPNLIELEMNNSENVTNKGIFRLFAKDENGMFAHSIIEVLNLNGTMVNNQGVAFLLENIPSLKVICYPNLPRVLHGMHKRDLHKNILSKAKTYNLTEVNVMCLAESPSLHDIMLVCIKVCPYIKNLHFPIMKQEDVDLCCKFTGLQSVRFKSFQNHDHTLNVDDFLKVRGSSLTELNLQALTVSVSVLAQYCPRLTTLKLCNIQRQHTKGSNPSFRNLHEFILHSADFRNNDEIDIASSILSSSPMLEKLSFFDCECFSPQINSEVLKCCTQCSIKYLDFTGSDVDFTLLQNILFDCTTLEFLAINDCINISDDNMHFLRDIASTVRNRPRIISSENFGGNDSDYDEYHSFDYTDEENDIHYDDPFNDDVYDGCDSDDEEDYVYYYGNGRFYI